MAPIDEEGGRREREHEFSRRALLRAGWTVPFALSFGGLAAACSGGDGDNRVHGDHSDRHGDAAHTDDGQLAAGDHLDTAHGDELHTDTGRYEHVDTPHGDHTDQAAPPSTEAGHADTHGDTTGGHTDRGPHSDHGDHTDTGGGGGPHVDTHGDTHEDAHTDQEGSIHGDSYSVSEGGGVGPCPPVRRVVNGSEHTDTYCVHEDASTPVHYDEPHVDTHTDTHGDQN